VTAIQSFARVVRRLGALRLLEADSNRNGCSYAVTLATPILPGHTQALKAVLDSFNRADRSPLACVPDVHVARWVVIDQLRTKYRCAPPRPSSLRTQYLLFSADVTAPAYRAGGLPNAFFRDMACRMKEECNNVWQHCWEFPGVDDTEKFVSYLVASQVDIGLYYAAFPDATPSEIASALEVRQELAQFARNHQDALPANSRAVSDALLEALYTDYVSRSATWGV
jgi:hypothetical protein